MPFLQNSEHCPRREAVMTGHASFLYEVASHVKKTAIPAIIIIISLDSERARGQWQCADVTPQVNLSFSFVSCVSKHLIEFIAIDS